MTLPAGRSGASLRPTLPWIVIAALAALAIVVSLLRPPSFDEMYWLTMARRIFGAGDLPYVDLLDNKGPLLYVLFGIADLVPVPERGVLTVLLAAATTALAAGLVRLAGRSGQPPGLQLFTASLVTVSMLGLGVWSVTTELISAAFLVWALLASPPWGRVLLMLAACLVDPRAVLFAPIVLLDGLRLRQLDGRHIATFSSLAVFGIAAVLLVPDLRYAFVEASLANRFDTNFADIAFTAVAAMCPVLVLAAVRVERIPRLAIATLVVATVIGLAASLPYGHYWVYVPLVLALVPISGPRVSRLAAGSVAALAITAIIASSADHWLYDASEAELTPVAVAMADLIEPGDTVAIWARSPHLWYRVASQTLGFAPTSNYFAWGLPDPDRLLQRLATDLEQATVLVMDSSLDEFRHIPTVESALDLVEARASQAPCLADLGDVTVYRFEGC